MPDPGPAATAVRVRGFAFQDLLIEVEAIAAIGEKTRLISKGHWDWSMAVSFSQGWKVGNLIFVGGQTSADQHGRTIGAGDIEVQTRNVFANIQKVLLEAGADMQDIVKLNTYYRFEGDRLAETEFWERITRVRMEYCLRQGRRPPPSGSKGLPLKTC